MTELTVSLLGAFRVAAPDGTPIPVDTRKARALLAGLLMARGRPVPRERLAGLFWSRGGSRQALGSLSQALYTLRRALDPHAPRIIQADTDTVAVDTGRVSCDALRIEILAAADETGDWQQALELYSGAFLDDLAIDAEEAYAEWRAGEQARLEDLATSAAARLMAAWESAPDTAEPGVVDHALDIDPYAEQAMRLRLRIMASEGRTGAAISAAQRFADRLAEDLGITPSAEFTALVEDIREGRLSTHASAPGAQGTAPGRHLPTRRALLGGAVALVLALIAAFWLLWPAPAPAPDGMRLLVRPFAAGEGIDAGYAAGFGDDLATELVRRTAVDVLSRETGRLVDAGATQTTGASHVLRGRLRQDGDRMVLNLWIAETGSGREIWAGRYDGTLTDLRGFRDQVVAGVAGEIDLALVAGPGAPSAPLPQDALPDHLRALSLLHAGTATGNAEAIGLLSDLVERYTQAPDPAAALVVAYERIAFDTADYAHAAGLHWLEGYLAMKVLLARHDAAHPDMLAARSRLALRRLDYDRAETLARQALRIEPAHVGALEALSETLAQGGRPDEGIRLAERAIALAPAAPAGGYTALALARLGAGDVNGARDAARTAREFARHPPLRLLALLTALEGLAGKGEADAARRDFIVAVESRPYGAWRLGEVTFSNPRAATWRRPSADETLRLFQFADPQVRARLHDGLKRAGSQPLGGADPADWTALKPDALDSLLIGHQITGRPSWLVQGDWRQVRTGDGALYQSSAFGPLPAADRGRSRTFGNRVCDSWDWQGATLETCQLVLPGAMPDTFVLVGEIGQFPFAVTE